MKAENDKLTWVTLLLCGLLQPLAVVFGFDYCDTGFYMTFYDNIFEAPATVEYNFMYYLSGLLGGAWLSVFGWGGIVGVRLLGMLTNLLCVWLLIRIYRGVIPAWATAIGAVIVTATCLIMPMAFYNDTLTALLLVGGVGLTVGGLNRGNLAMIAGGGALLGINLFARVPNLLDILLGALVPIHCTLSRRHDGLVSGLAAFAGGYCIGVAAVVALMAALGHLSIYIDNVSQLLTASARDNGSTHGVGALIEAQGKGYMKCFIALVKLSIAALVAAAARFLKWRPARVAVRLACLAYVAYMLICGNAVYPVAAVTLAALTGEIVAGRSPRVKLYAWGALIVSLLFPLGSDGAMANNGTIVYWLGAPLAVSFCYDLTRRVVGVSAARRAMIAVTATVVTAMTVTVMTGGTYFDGMRLDQMTGTIDSGRARGLLTSPGRAATVNAMIEAVESHLSPGDTLLVFGSMPALNYLTATRPAIGCSWPELLDPTTLQSRLDSAPCPTAIMVQKFPTIGSRYRPPSPAFAAGTGSDNNMFHTAEKCDIINRYITLHRCRPVVDTPSFTLYLPPKKR